MPKKIRIPSYRLHKGSGQAVVVLNGRSIYLGLWNSSESRTKYERVIAEWLANRRSFPRGDQCAANSSSSPLAGLTISDLILGFWRFAEGYYKPDPERRGL